MWHARPVFISGTFEDMQAERDHLRTHVFPELEERLKARRHHLEWVECALSSLRRRSPQWSQSDVRVWGKVDMRTSGRDVR